MFLINQAEAQSSGTTVTTGNNASGRDTAFDEVVIGTNMTLTFDNAHPLTGLNGYKVQLNPAVVTAATYLGWSNSVIGNPIRRLYGGFSLWFNVIPPSTIRFVKFINGAATALGWLGVASGGGNLQFRNSSDAALGTASSGLSANTLYRCMFDVFFDATSAYGRAWVYNASTGARLAADAWFNGSVLGTGAYCNHVQFGATTNNFSSTLNDNFVFDDVWISDEPSYNKVAPNQVFIPGLLWTPVQQKLWTPPPLQSAPVSANTFNQALSAAIAAGGVLLKSVGKNVVANVTSTGSVSKAAQKLMSAPVAASAAVSKSVGKLLSAPVTATAAVTALKVKVQSLVANVAASAVVTKVVNKPVQATVTSTAALAKTVSKFFTAPVNITASVNKAVGKALSAPVAITATIGRAITFGRAMVANVAITATLKKTVNKLLSAPISSTASMTRVANKILSAPVTATATVVKTVAKTVKASVFAVGGMAWVYFPFSGTTFNKTLTASVNATASVSRAVSKNVVATVTATASIARVISTKLTASVTATGIVIRGIPKALVANVAVTASLLRGKVWGKTVTASIAITATLSGKYKKGLVLISAGAARVMSLIEAVKRYP